MKVIFPLFALAFFLFLVYLTHPAKRDETPQSVEKQNFFFKDFIHGTTITGSWIDEDYVVKMEINSIRLDMKLAFEFTENMGSTDINSSPDGNGTPKHGKIPKFKECPKYPQNATCQDFETFRPRSPGLIATVWDILWTMMRGAQNKCYGITAAMAAGVWNGVTWLAEWVWDKVTSLADGIWNGVSLMADGIWNGATWLTDGVLYGITWTADGVLNGVTMLAEWIWDGVTWLTEWVWNEAAWLAEWIWSAVAWTGTLFLPGNYVTDAVVKFYYGYLDSHVNHIQARVAASSWQDVFYMMSAVFVLNFVLLVMYLLVTCTVNFIQRLWQARKDRITAAKLPPAPKKPIWRPKPKKRRRKNKNSW